MGLEIQEMEYGIFVMLCRMRNSAFIVLCIACKFVTILAKFHMGFDPSPKRQPIPKTELSTFYFLCSHLCASLNEE